MSPTMHLVSLFEILIWSFLVSFSASVETNNGVERKNGVLYDFSCPFYDKLVTSEKLMRALFNNAKKELGLPRGPHLDDYQHFYGTMRCKCPLV